MNFYRMISGWIAGIAKEGTTRKSVIDSSINIRYLFSTPDSERFAFLVVSGQSGFAACPPLRKLLKPSGKQALRPDFISFLGVLNNYNISIRNVYMVLRII